jgi:hypothetical protein
MQRYESMEAYFAAQAGHPGAISDEVNNLVHDGRDFRLMTLSDSGALLLQASDAKGPVWELGHVHDREILDALLDPVKARRELDGSGGRLGVTELISLLDGRPQDVAGEQRLINAYQQRQEQVQEVIQDGMRRSYMVAPLSMLPLVPEEDLHRRDQVDYSQADWRKLAPLAVDYLRGGGDPLNHSAVLSAAESANLDPAEAKWFSSIFIDSVYFREGEFGDGRHRTMEMMRQGVEELPIYTASEMQRAERKALLIRAEAPLLALSSLDDAASSAPTAVPDHSPSLSI